MKKILDILFDKQDENEHIGLVSLRNKERLLCLRLDRQKKLAKPKYSIDQIHLHHQ